MSDRGDSSRGGPGQLVVIVLILVVGMAFLERFSRPTGGEETAPIPLPQLLVEGWMNTESYSAIATSDAPSVESLRGQWVVVDCWATWCRPCVQSLPRLAKVNQRWSNRGVVLMGLTSETSDSMDAIQSVVDRTEGLSWPIAYGANMVLDQLSVTALPTLVLFDPEGHSVWRGHSVDSLEEQLKQRIGG